ncbi:MAG TPA: NADH/ubiquinone/plastoquinone (complex I), partial [Elusimicrobia bacterium]|nr:NADH/ubiquinone/plastoquinone (complex I) [Elusimicrobiota bacterium]
MLLLIFILLPIVSALILILYERINKESGSLITFTSTLINLSIVIFLFFISSDNRIVYHIGGWPSPLGISLVLDSFSLLMLFVINLISCLSMLYSIDYIKHYDSRAKFFILNLFLIAGLNGVVLSGDIFNLYIFLEIIAFASYALIAFGLGKEDLEASIRYQVIGTIGSFFIFFGIGFLYSVTGSLDLADISKIIHQHSATNRAILFAIPLLLFGFSLKAALVPFHAWLPDAHPTAPAPVSAMLSGVVIKVSGIYGIVRIFFSVTGVSTTLLQILLYAGLISVFFGAFAALYQNDFKRILAYSSISQIGYIMLGIGIGTPLGYAGALLHIINHAAFKSLFFMVAGAVNYATGKRDTRELGGLSKKMPITYISSISSSLSLAGIPPFGGFFSKFLILLALVKANHLTLSILLVISFLLTLAYFIKIHRRVFLRSENSELYKNVKEVPYSMRIAMIILAIICLGLGLTFPWIMKTFINSAVNIFTNGINYGNIIS